MESEDIAWADTCDGAVRANGKYDSDAIEAHYYVTLAKLANS